MRLCRSILSREGLSLISRSLREHDLISFRLELSFELGLDFRREFQSVVHIVRSFCRERSRSWLRCPVAHAAWSLFIIPDELWDFHSTCAREDGLYLCKCLAHLLRRAHLAAYSSALVWFNDVFEASIYRDFFCRLAHQGWGPVRELNF